MIDTNNFMNKTGVRTFEAAAYPAKSRSGSDARVARCCATTWRNTRRERRRYATRRFTAVHLRSPCARRRMWRARPIVGAQAANELLDIVGIKASFVLTEYQAQDLCQRAVD